MNRRSLGAIAIILIALMAFVAMAGLDSLPRSLRQSAEAAAAQVASERAAIETDRAAVLKALEAEPELFAGRSAELRSKVDSAAGRLAVAESRAVRLKVLAQANRREDREAAERELREFEEARMRARAEVEAIRREVDRWVGYKEHAPELLSSMKDRYEGIQSFDIPAATAPAQKAAIDWPAKKDDIEARLRALSERKEAADRAWEASAEARAKAEAKDWAAVDYATLISSAEKLETAAKDLRSGAESLNALAGQLYVNWDKLLLELDEQNGTRRQRVRVVRTKYPDASLQNGNVSQEEQWENVTAARDKLERSVGMVIERKPAGKYDSESETTVQAPAYAYIAPPGQSNQYGSWSNGVWHWLPQYLILSQLLRGPSYPPIRTDDWRDYDGHRRRGETWYGRDGRYNRSWGTYRERGSSAGSAMRRALEGMVGGSGSSSGPRAESPRPRERWKWGGSAGSFGGSRYQSRGTFGGSRYQSRSSGGFGFRSYSRGLGRALGRGGRR